MFQALVCPPDVFAVVSTTSKTTIHLCICFKAASTDGCLIPSCSFPESLDVEDNSLVAASELTA